MSNVEFIDPEDLAKVVKDTTKVSGKDYVIVDVRDDDFEGGNIPNCINIPLRQVPDRLPSMVTDYQQVPQVVFHCALSQVRGPKAARIYHASLNGIQTQKVQVLRGGFTEWQEKYKDDPVLVENYDQDRWIYD